MPPQSVRDQERMREADDRMLGLVAQGFQQRTENVNAERRATLGADLQLRNQEVQNAEQFRYGQMEAEAQVKRQLDYQKRQAELELQLREVEPKDAAMDFMLETGIYPRLVEKMAEDSQLQREVDSIMGRKDLRSKEKVAAILQAEAASSQRLTVSQKTAKFEQKIKANQVTIPMPDGSSVNYVQNPFDPKNLLTTHIKPPETGGYFDDAPEEAQIPWDPNYTGADRPKRVKQWRPGMMEKWFKETYGEYKGALTVRDKEAFAVERQFAESGIDPQEYMHPNDFAVYQSRLATARQHEEEASAAIRKGLGGKVEQDPVDNPKQRYSEVIGLQEEYDEDGAKFAKNNQDELVAILGPTPDRTWGRDRWGADDVTPEILAEMAKRRIRKRSRQNSLVQEPSGETAPDGEPDRAAMTADAQMLTDMGLPPEQIARFIEGKYGVKVNP